MPQPLAPIGRAIDARRTGLGLTLAEVAKAADMSVEQLRAIRYGENSPRGLSRAAIERALKWEAGSVDRVINEDGEPTPSPVVMTVVASSPDDDHVADLATLRRIYTGEKEGDQAAVVNALRRMFEDDPIAPGIMDQGHKAWDDRWTELYGWLKIRTRGETLKKALRKATNRSRLP